MPKHTPRLTEPRWMHVGENTGCTYDFIELPKQGRPHSQNKRLFRCKLCGFRQIR